MPLHDESGKVIGTFGISRDITKRKLAEIAVQRNQERMATVIATQQDVAMTDQELDATLLLIAERAQSLAQADAAAILLQRRGNARRPRMLRPTERVPELARSIRPAACSEKCLTAGAPIVRGEVESGELAISGFTASSLAAVPINYANKNVGVLCVVSSEPNMFDERDAESLQLLAEIVTSAMGQDELKRTRRNRSTSPCTTASPGSPTAPSSATASVRRCSRPSATADASRSRSWTSTASRRSTTRSGTRVATKSSGRSAAACKTPCAQATPSPALAATSTAWCCRSKPTRPRPFT